jgi:hypothetical protein
VHKATSQDIHTADNETENVESNAESQVILSASREGAEEAVEQRAQEALQQKERERGMRQRERARAEVAVEERVQEAVQQREREQRERAREERVQEALHHLLSALVVHVQQGTFQSLLEDTRNSQRMVEEAGATYSSQSERHIDREREKGREREKQTDSLQSERLQSGTRTQTTDTHTRSLRGRRESEKSKSELRVEGGIMRKLTCLLSSLSKLLYSLSSCVNLVDVEGVSLDTEAEALGRTRLIGRTRLRKLLVEEVFSSLLLSSFLSFLLVSLASLLRGFLSLLLSSLFSLLSSLVSLSSLCSLLSSLFSLLSSLFSLLSSLFSLLSSLFSPFVSSPLYHLSYRKIMLYDALAVACSGMMYLYRTAAAARRSSRGWLQSKSYVLSPLLYVK